MTSISDTTHPQVITVSVPSSDTSNNVTNGTVDITNGVRPGTMDNNRSILRTGSSATLQAVHVSDINSISRIPQQGQGLVRRTNTELVTVTNVSPATTVVNIATLVDDGSGDYVSYDEDLSQGVETTLNDTSPDIVGVSGDASHGLVTTVSHISQLIHKGGAGEAVIKRKRGRPPKRKLPEDALETPNVNSDATPSSPGTIGTVKRKRGRLPKRNIYIIRQESETPGASPGVNAESEVVRVTKPTDGSPPVKRRPGRPRKMKPTHAGEGSSGRSMSEPRASSRLASRRKSGYVAPWKALMRSSREDEEEDEESSEGEESEEEVVKKTSVPVRGATPGKRGRGRPPRVAQPPPPPPAPPVDVAQTLEEILQMDTGQTPEQTQEKPFSNAAVCVSRYTTDQLAATDAGLDVVMGQLTAVLGLTWSVAGEQTHFLHGDLSTLLQAQHVLQQVCEGQSLEESFASQNLSIVTLIQATDENTEEPQPPDTTLPPEDREEENHMDENDDDELAVEDELLSQAAEEAVSQVTDTDSVAIEPATDQPEEHPEEGLEEEPEEPLVMINPTTGERYSKTCAIYTNPEMATMTCDVCNFVTTEKGLLKHKMRKHPELVFECEICLEKFGVRYDMRRHRIQHFDQDGVLKATFEPSFRNRFPEFTGPITLGILESEFSVKEEEENGEPEQSEPSEKKDTAPSKPNRLPTLKAVKKIHMCDECDFQGPPASLSKHKIRNHPRFLYKCPKCPFELGELVDFLRHYTKHDDSTENVREINLEDLGDFCHCTACEHQGTEDDLILHVKTEHPHRLVCTRCDLVFLNQRMLQRHFRTEHRDLYLLPSKQNKKLQLPRDVSRCACEVCGQEVRLSWYHQHMKTHNRVTLRCHFCGFETWKRFAMKNHLLTKHGPKQFMCHICGQTFSYKSAHQNHIKNKHSDTPQVFPCPHCEKTFTVRRFMTTHVKRMHLKENKHFCDICGRGFFEKVKMKQHREVHAPAEHREATKQYQCGECGSRFRDRAKLLQHANIHSGERPFKCTTCNKSFTWKAELTKHQVSKHTEERPFRCTVCHKAFKFRYKLTTHMITHTRQSRHTCPTCGKAFTQRATLRKHRCRLPVYTDSSGGATQSYVQIQGDTGQTEEIYIQLEEPDGTSAVVGADSLAQLEAAGADTEGGSVTFMCGMCQQLFSTAAEINDHVLTEHGESVTLVVESDSAEMNQIPEMNVHEVELEDAPDPEQVMAAEQLANQVNAHQIERCVEIHYSNEHEQLAESEELSEEQFVYEEQATELLIHDDNTAEQQQVVEFEVVEGDVIEQDSEVLLTEETVLGSDEQVVTVVHMVEDLEVEEQLVEETGEQVMIVDETHTVDTVIE